MAIQKGAATDEMFELRQRKRDLDAESKEIKENMEALENQLIQSLDEDASTMTRGSKASASISESDVYIIEDLDEFYKYILENEALYLLQSRPAQGALEELYSAGETVPGIRVMEKRKISLRKIQPPTKATHR